MLSIVRIQTVCRPVCPKFAKEKEMSTSGVSSSASSILLEELLKYKAQTKQSALDQLGTDLQSGNLSAAQSDFAALTGDASSTTSTASNDPVVQDLVTLSKDLKSGDTAAAEKDYTALKSDLKKAQPSTIDDASTSSNTEAEQLLKLLQSLATSSSAAASAYTTGKS
jgi:hypothetical protein